MFTSKSALALGAFAALAACRDVSTQNPDTYDPIDRPIFQLSPDFDLAFFLEEVLSLAEHGGSNTGEVLRIATQLVAGDESSVYGAFYPFAEAIHALAESVDPAVDPVGARENYFHAATYYRAASEYLVADPEDPRLISLWDRQIVDFKRAIALLRPVPGEPFTVRAGDSSIGPYDVPGYFYKAEAGGRKRVPTFIVVSGYDGSQEELYHSVCVEVLRRGMNCATYEGPGQPSPRRYQGIGFIPDWWTATSPVVDYVSGRADVDTARIALMGLSFGGILAPRAASRDPRVSAVVLLDGLVSLQRSVEDDLPPSATAAFEAGNATEFDAFVEGLIGDPSIPITDRYVFQQGLYTFNTTSPFDWFTRVGDINVTSEIVRGVGKRPVFVAMGQDDNQTHTQASIAYDMFVKDRPNGEDLTYFHEFQVGLGAGEHCSMGAETQVWTSIAGWLSRIWGGYRFENTA